MNEKGTSDRRACSSPCPALTFPASSIHARKHTESGFRAEFSVVILRYGEYWTGEYSTEWASHGLQSYVIHIPYAEGCSSYPGANTYGEVFQNVDLTWGKQILFDMRAYGGGWVPPPQYPQYYTSAEVWIDGTQVYTREGQNGTFYDQVIPVTGFSGTHRLALRMRVHADSCVTADRGMNVDNIRLVLRQVFLPVVIRD